MYARVADRHKSPSKGMTGVAIAEELNTEGLCGDDAKEWDSGVS